MQLCRRGRVVVLRPPTILYKLQLIPPGYVWLVHKAIYGLREAPNLWSEERTDMLSSGEPDHFRQADPLPPDPNNADHNEWIKKGSKNSRWPTLAFY